MQFFCHINCCIVYADFNCEQPVEGQHHFTDDIFVYVTMLPDYAVVNCYVTVKLH